MYVMGIGLFVTSVNVIHCACTNEQTVSRNKNNVQTDEKVYEASKVEIKENENDEDEKKNKKGDDDTDQGDDVDDADDDDEEEKRYDITDIRF